MSQCSSLSRTGFPLPSRVKWRRDHLGVGHHLVQQLTPVALLPGRLSLARRPSLTGSGDCTSPGASAAACRGPRHRPGRGQASGAACEVGPGPIQIPLS